MSLSPDDVSIASKIRVPPEVRKLFADWQAKFHEAIANMPGFVSLEILSPKEWSAYEWMIVEKFVDRENLKNWRSSPLRQNLFLELRSLLGGSSGSICEVPLDFFNQQGCVTEIFVTEVSADKEMDYRTWIAKIHQVEAKFPGFRGVYVQSPQPGKGKHWITLLQFDTPENLDRWLFSQERKAVLSESESMISALDSHRVISPYAGWFASMSKGAETASIWKQAMIVLLVLFPLVMLQGIFLSPWLTGLNPSVAMFISNVISVSLVTWPTVPLAIGLLSWWLVPKPEMYWRMTILGTLVVLALYAIEILLFM